MSKNILLKKQGGGGANQFTELTDTPSSYSSHSLKGVRVNTGENALEFYSIAGDTDEKVAVDSEATAGYLGAASNDGVLRTGSPLTYTDGGDFITLDIDETLIDHDVLTNTHNLTTDIDHDLLTNFLESEHFTEASISHLNILNIGTKTHAQIDTHLGLEREHIDWTDASENFLTTGSMGVGGGAVFNEAGTDAVFRIEGVQDPYLFNIACCLIHGAIGFGTQTPARKFHFNEPYSLQHAYIRLEATTGKHSVYEFVEAGTRRGYIEYHATNHYLRIKTDGENADIFLDPAGTGKARFGTYVADGPRVDGYIEIKDAGGTLRRLLVATPD